MGGKSSTAGSGFGRRWLLSFGRMSQRLVSLALTLLVIVGAPPPVVAQEAPVAGAGPHDAAANTGHEHLPSTEIEFAGSTTFQSGLAAIRVARSPLLIDAHFYGVDTNEIGMVGLAWELRYHGFRVMPGLGWAFGQENRPALAFTTRWGYEGERWLAQGQWVQSLKAHVPAESEGHARSDEHDEEVVEHSGALEGHLSAVVGRLEIGPAFEHIRYREENEWKGGGRGAWRLGHGFKVVTYVLAPDPEFRAGFAWEW